MRLRYPDATTTEALIEQDGLETAVVCVDQPLAETQAAARRAGARVVGRIRYDPRVTRAQLEEEPGIPPVIFG